MSANGKLDKYVGPSRGKGSARAVVKRATKRKVRRQGKGAARGVEVTERATNGWAS